MARDAPYYFQCVVDDEDYDIKSRSSHEEKAPCTAHTFTIRIASVLQSGIHFHFFAHVPIGIYRVHPYIQCASAGTLYAIEFS